MGATVVKQWFDQYYNILCNYAFGILQDRDASEDVVQGLFLHLLEHEPTQVQHPKAFLIRSTHSRCIDFLRKKNVEEKTIIFWQEKMSDETNWEQKMDAFSIKELIFESIRHLPPQCSHIFVLAKIEGFSYQEIAEKLELSVKTIENQMGKALKLVRTHLKDKI